MATGVKTFTATRAADLRTYLELVKYHARKTRAFAEVEFSEALKDISVLERVGRKPMTEADVLDIGCGGRATQALILHTLGVRIIGIDYDQPEGNLNPSSLVRLARYNGAQRAFKTLFRHVLFDRQYYREVERLLGRKLVHEGLDVRRMDACHLEFPDESFDYAISNAVFEHIYDVDRALRELRRVLRPGGAARISTHLFPSLSGGHRLEWAYPDEQPSTTVPPWDHLRAKQFPTHVYLNGLREREYLDLFARYFQILDVATTTEGRDLLTEELSKELAEYSIEDLTHSNLTVVIQKSENVKR